MRESQKKEKGKITLTINPTFLPTECTGPHRHFSKVNSLPTQETGNAFSEPLGTVTSKMVQDSKPAGA